MTRSITLQDVTFGIWNLVLVADLARVLKTDASRIKETRITTVQPSRAPCRLIVMRSFGRRCTCPSGSTRAIVGGVRLGRGTNAYPWTSCVMLHPDQYDHLTLDTEFGIPKVGDLWC